MSDPRQQEQLFLERVRAALDEQTTRLDADTLRDLRLARARAVATLQRPRRVWQPVALAAMAASLAAVVVTLHLLHTTPATTTAGLEDMAILSAGDDFELYENLEFYQWLDLEQHNS